MESLPTEERGAWELSAAALEKLLARLDPDPDAAADAYVRLQLRLATFFEQRRFAPADEHASAVLDRLARKIDEGEQGQNPTAYALGVARLYALELSRKPIVEGVDDWDAVPAARARLSTRPEQEPEGEDVRLGCLDRCLEGLAAHDRRMVVGYYQDDRRAKIDNRKELSDALGINMNTLRLRVRARAGFDSYEVALRTREGREVLTRAGLAPHGAQGAQAVTVLFPADKLAAGDYVVTLTGRRADGTPEIVGEYAVTVEKK